MRGTLKTPDDPAAIQNIISSKAGINTNEGRAKSAVVMTFLRCKTALIKAPVRANVLLQKMRVGKALVTPLTLWKVVSSCWLTVLKESGVDHPNNRCPQLISSMATMTNASVSARWNRLSLE